MTSDKIKFALDKFITVFFAVRSAEEKPSKRSYLVELALAERDSRRFFFLFFFVRRAPIRRPCSPAFLAENVETGNKNRDDFHCIQMRLVMSMRLFVGDD